jgi:hypothetical protein
MMFTTDNRTEAFLKFLGVKFNYTNNLTMEALHGGWDVVNAGRPQARRENAINEYAALMESGSPAPAVIVRRLPDGKISVLDGVQRLAAAIKSGFTRFSAYVVDTDSEDMIESIRSLANVRLQGHTEKPEWQVRNAVQRLVIDRGMSAKEVARLGGWKPANIERLETVLRCGFQIRCIGGPQQLPDGIVFRISEVASDDELRIAAKPVAAFLNAVNKGRFSTEDALPYIDRFFAHVAKRSEAVAVYGERLQEFLEEPEVETRLHGRASPGMAADVNLRRAMKTCIGILDRIAEDGGTLRYVDEFFRLNKQIDARLRKHAPHCAKPDTPRTPADKWAKSR